MAGFIGSPAMNFLEAVVRDGAVEVPALKTRVSVPATLPAEGTAVTIGLRPEHLELLADLLERGECDAKPEEFRRYGSARKLYNFNIDNAY